MTSMFPGYGKRDRSQDGPAGRPGPTDYNRFGRSEPAELGVGGQPRPLRWAHWLLIGGAIILLTSSFVGFFGADSAGEAIAESAASRTNRLFVAGANFFGGFLLALMAPSMLQGAKTSRRVITVVIALVLFFNIAALALGLAGLIVLLIPVLLAFALLFMYRPSVNRFMDGKHSDSYE